MSNLSGIEKKAFHVLSDELAPFFKEDKESKIGVLALTMNNVEDMLYLIDMIRNERDELTKIDIVRTACALVQIRAGNLSPSDAGIEDFSYPGIEILDED